MNNKRLPFLLFMQLLIDWYRDYCSKVKHIKGLEEQDSYIKKNLNLIKVMKLLFFVASQNATKDNYGLLDTFNNFYALPYGHVESDIYNEISYFTEFKLLRKSIEYTTINNDWNDGNIRTLILESIDKIKQHNIDFIDYDAFKLVDISHRRKSWQLMYSLAEQNDLKAMHIPLSLIATESKILDL